MLLSALISALNGATAKLLSDNIDAFEMVFYRNLIGIIIILYALKHTPPILKGGKIHLLFLRGLFGTIAMLLFFYTITAIPLGEAITLNKTSPFFVTILAFYLVNEKININTIFALIIGFIGIVLIVKPFGMVFSYDHILGILGGFFAAAAYATIKKIKDIYDTRVIMLSFMGIGTLIPFFFIELKFYTDYTIWTLIIFMAVISTLSQWLLTKAYTLSRASIIGVVSYTNIPFAIGFGWMLGDLFPDFWTFTGIGLIILGGILVGRNKRS
ncbi:MAG: EamA family transporter [Campylobacteraceae bacterium]|nr:EamA family transporter [Campylobacteraceae bacterium]